jgi:abortive infection bacteriophage resistance protein
MRTVVQQARHASPRKRTLAGIFLHPNPQSGAMKFSKPALSIDDQLSKLISKGLRVTDPQKAKQCLASIGYYRLSAYAYPFRMPTNRKQFKPGTDFEQILKLYEFDRELRLLVNDAVERCEVAIRSQIVNITALAMGPHWFLDAKNFQPGYRLTNLHGKMEEAVGIRLNPANGNKNYPTKHSETFISHYYTKYGDPDLPPIWMTAEMLSFGVLSRLFSCFVDPKIQKEIATPFGVHPKVFRQWLQSLSYLRNLCAHHSRLWNRVFSVPPKVSKKHKGLITHPDRFYASAVVLFDLLKSIQGGDGWALRLDNLLAAFPEVDPAAMGFSNNWKAEAFWNFPQPPSSP